MEIHDRTRKKLSGTNGEFGGLVIGSVYQIYVNT
jgi:hypothetical protein